MTRGLTAAACAATTTALLIFLWKRRRAIINEILDALDDAARARAFDHLPERIILLRHGESEANIDPSILGHKPTAFHSRAQETNIQDIQTDLI